MFPSHALLALSLAAGVLASPMPRSVAAASNSQCAAVSDVVSLIGLLPSPTPFCSSFLGIQTITSNATSTQTIPVTSSYITTTGTITYTADPVYVSQTVTTTVTTCILSKAALDPVKRHLEERGDTIVTKTRTNTKTTCLETPTPAVAAPPATKWTTSVVYTTVIYTVTSCAATVTNCPAKLGQVTTDTILLYTTVCPVTETEGSSSGPHAFTSAISKILAPTYTNSSGNIQPTATNTFLSTGLTASASSSALSSSTTPLALSDFGDAAISTACQCLSIPTPSLNVTYISNSTTTVQAPIMTYAVVTVTPTTTLTFPATATATACPTPDSSCSNTGVQYAAWTNSQVETDSLYTTFEPALYKSNKAQFYGNSTTSFIGFETGTCTIATTCTSATIYKTYIPSTGYIVLQHRGYIFAPISGTYTFTVHNGDNDVLIWLGANAYSGYTKANAALIDADFLTGQDYSTTLQLEAEQWYPLRVMYANSGGPGELDLTITAPDGTVIMSYEVETPYLMQYSCDGVYPPFADWNAES